MDIFVFSLCSKQDQPNKFNNQQNSQVNSNRIIANNTHKNIEISFNISEYDGTEAYYSDRYGWFKKSS